MELHFNLSWELGLLFLGVLFHSGNASCPANAPATLQLLWCPSEYGALCQEVSVLQVLVKLQELFMQPSSVESCVLPPRPGLK